MRALLLLANQLPYPFHLLTYRLAQWIKIAKFKKFLEIKTNCFNVLTPVQKLL